MSIELFLFSLQCAALAVRRHGDAVHALLPRSLRVPRARVQRLPVSLPLQVRRNRPPQGRHDQALLQMQGWFEISSLRTGISQLGLGLTIFRIRTRLISYLFLLFHDVFLSVLCIVIVTNEQNTLLSAASEQQWPTPSHRLGLKTSHETRRHLYRWITWIFGVDGVETQPLLYAVQTKEYQKFGDKIAAVNGA